MGIKIHAVLDNQLKPNYTQAGVLPAAFTVADTQCAIWIGNAFVGGKGEEIRALENCLKFIRDNGSTTPTGSNESYAETPDTMGKSVTGAFGSAIDTALTGTVSVTISTAAVVGVGTAFETELVVGDSIKIAGEIHTVSVITDNTNLTLSTNHAAGASGVTFALVAVPHEANMGIWYGPDFQQTPGASISPTVKRLIEYYMEQTQKAALA